MKKKIYYWAPFFSNIATVKAVINSAISIKKFSTGELEPVIIDIFGEWGAYKETLIKNNIQVDKLGLNKFFKKKKINGYILSRYYQIKIFFLAFFPLLNLVKRNKPDTLIVHLLTSLPLFLNLIFKFNTKIILRVSGLPKLNIFRRIFWKLALKNIKFITTPTEATRSNLSKILLNKDIFLLRDPIINLRKINFIKKNEDKKDYYLSIGRLTKQKNFIFLLRCFRSLIKKNNKYKLKILGEGEDYKRLSNFIYKNKLEKNIFLEGYKENVYNYLANAKAFILSSLWEDPGFVLIEAAYSNVSIISSDCQNGPKEILENGKNGFIFNSNDINSFLKIFSTFENSNEKSIFRKRVNAKKMSKKYSLFSHYLELKKII